MSSAPPEGSTLRSCPAYRRVLAVGTSVVVATGLLLAPSPAAADEALPDLVTAENILGHLEKLQEIADKNDGNRAEGTPGYDAAAAYVMDQLEEAGYTPEKHTYEFDRWSEHATPELAQTGPEQHDFVHEDDFITLTYSGAGEITATGAAVNSDSDASGCAAEDFTEFPEGAVAIMRRGACSFEEKANNAVDAGAAGAVIFNQGGESEEDTEAFLGTLSNPVDIPVLSTSTAVGEDLAATGEDLEIRMSVDSDVSTTTSYSVLADTSGGSENNTVVVGAHLDSVAEGPGINDNGSGSAAILETAKQLSTLDEPTNQIRFAFWGTEEEGLIGSTKYVESLSEAELEDIALYLNFDMVGSPNYGRFVFDGRGEMDESMPPPPGSAAIQETFEDYFAEVGLENEPTPLDGRSDYAAFVEAGIPSGGLFSGADGIKTEEQAEHYGGTAGELFDPNYHTPDDTIDNVDESAVDELSGGIAYAVQTYADTLPVNGATDKVLDVPSGRQADFWSR